MYLFRECILPGLELESLRFQHPYPFSSITLPFQCIYFYFFSTHDMLKCY